MGMVSVAERVHGLHDIDAGLSVLCGCRNINKVDVLLMEQTLSISGFLWVSPLTFNILSDDSAFPNAGNRFYK
jgi:hypothetical protein